MVLCVRLCNTNSHSNATALLCNNCFSCQPHFGCCVQALILGVKLVLYTGAGLLFAGCIHAVGTSPLFWHMCKEVCSHMWSASAEVQAFFVTLTFAGFCALLEEVWHSLSTDA